MRTSKNLIMLILLAALLTSCMADILLSAYVEKLPSYRESTLLGLKVIELTNPIQNEIIKWFGVVNEVSTIATVPVDGYYSRFLNNSGEHVGTHVDAPVHFNPYGLFINEVPIESLYGVAVVIDVRKYVSHPNDTITMSELMDWEKKVGIEIPRGSIVILYTGWANYWGLYTNWDQYWSIANGWPGLSPDAARYLVSKEVKGIGVDTLSIDPAPATNFPAHYILTEAGLYIVENLNTNLERLADNAAFIIMAPFKLKEGSAGPGLEVLAIYDPQADIRMNLVLANLIKTSLDLSEKYDLAFTVENSIPAWFTLWKGFMTVGSPEEMIKKYMAYYGSLTMNEHVGTHMDAPAHFAVGVWRIDEVPIDRFLGRAVIMDMRPYIKHPNYSITLEDIKSWEKKSGIVISKGDIILIYTGWARYWGTYRSWDEYWNTIGKGFPGLAPDAAWYLVSKGVKGVALDTLSIDPPPQAVDFPVHKIIVNANIWIGENFNLAILPKKDATAYIISLPAMIVKEGSGAPARPVLIYNFNLESILNTYNALKQALNDEGCRVSYALSTVKQSSNLGLLMISLAMMFAATICLIRYGLRD
ncbi:MAG: cyclase family protein [Sulfolobales archaeon]